jgi:hypothetical protein
MSLKDQHLMKKDSLVYSRLSESSTEVAKSRARVLIDFEAMAKKNREWVESLQEQQNRQKRRSIPETASGCSKCQARWANPHADYHLTALIDDSKI